LANFDFDQAEGLRRMVAGPRPRIISFLSAATPEEKGAMLANLAASLVRAGSEVLLLDATPGARGIASKLGAPHGATLMEVARGERDFAHATHAAPQEFCVATLTRGPLQAVGAETRHAAALAELFQRLASGTDVMMIDAELGGDDFFPIAAMAGGEIVVQVANHPDSIKAAYALIKRLHAQLGRRPFGILVTGASEREAKQVYANMARAASRYLAVELHSLGSVPADEHLKQATRLGRTVVDAFPLAGASVAFRQLAGRFAMTVSSPAGTGARA